MFYDIPKEGEEMYIEERFYDQTWVQELSNEDFRMLHYLFHFASKKTGIVELNMRMLNFAANTGTMYTKDDVLSKFRNLIRLIPGKDNTAIFPDYIATNWAKNGKPIDLVKNPLFKAVAAELAANGMTIADVNAMAKKKIIVRGEESVDEPVDVPVVDVVRDSGGGRERLKVVTDADAERMFNAFWESYPRRCPRKVDKQKCKAKFIGYLRKCTTSDGVVQLFNAIMQGLGKWKRSDTWTKDGGQYIRAPLVWLNNMNWNDEPTGGNYGTNQSGGNANRNHIEAADETVLF